MLVRNRAFRRSQMARDKAKRIKPEGFPCETAKHDAYKRNLRAAHKAALRDLDGAIAAYDVAL